MTLTFKKASGKNHSFRKNCVYLNVDSWDDYSFKTTFDVTVVDSDGESHYLGEIKIGFVGQDHGWTRDALDDEFTGLGEKYF